MNDNDWAPAERAAIEAFAEQHDLAVREVERWSSLAFDLCGDEDKLRRKYRWFINRHREWMAVYPVVEDGVLGGRDGNATRGNDSATYCAPRGHTDLREYDPDDPNQGNVPIIILGWKLQHAWIVRAPLSIADILGGFQVAHSECNWHNDRAKLDSGGGDRRSLLILAGGQYVLVLYVCASCRERLTREYGNGLRWLGLDTGGRVVIPR